MRISKIFLFPVVCFLFGSCSFLMNGPQVKPSSYKYYNSAFTLQKSDIIRIDGFYYYKYMDNKNEGVYSYLRFYKNGRVDNVTSITPPESLKEKYSQTNDVYGYYKIEGNKLWYELKSRYKNYELVEGIINSDTIKVKIFNKQNKLTDTMYRDYIFHEGFAQ